MRITVIMPAHNAGPWIAEALSSIAAQQRKPDEVIVIDDASTDETASIARASGVPTQLLSTSLGNAAAARNEGLRHATGDWIAFLDADDLWLSHHLAQAAELLEGTDDVGYVARPERLYENDQILPVRLDWPVTKPTNGLTHRQYIEFWMRTVHILPTAMLVKRDRLMEIGGFDVSQLRRHDFPMWLRVIHDHTWTFNPTVTVRWRCDTPGSISRINVASADYYQLRGMLSIADLYADTPLHRLTAMRARQAVASAYDHGDAEDRRRAWALARPHLSMKDRWVLGLGACCPPLLTAMIRRRRRRIAEVRETNDRSIES